MMHNIYYYNVSHLQWMTLIYLWCGVCINLHREDSDLS